MNGGSRFKLWKSIEGDHSRAVSHARRGGLALLLMQGTTLPTAGLLFEGGAVADDCQCGRARQNLAPFFSQKMTFLKIPETN